MSCLSSEPRVFSFQQACNPAVRSHSVTAPTSHKTSPSDSTTLYSRLQSRSHYVVQLSTCCLPRRGNHHHHIGYLSPPLRSSSRLRTRSGVLLASIEIFRKSFARLCSRPRRCAAKLPLENVGQASLCLLTTFHVTSLPRCPVMLAHLDQASQG